MTLSRMRIAELFHSVQGEGKLVGIPSVFVRASGCNLRCTWCDTPYASWSPEGNDESIESILDRVGNFSTRHVVVTGGEPMIMPDIALLCAGLKAAKHHITIETAATHFVSVPVDLASLSPKLSNSTPWQRDGGRFAEAHEAHRLNIPVIQQWIDCAPEFQLKFVVASEGDLQEIEDLLTKLSGWAASDILLMPEGTDAKTLESRAGWITEICLKRGYRFCPRLHIALFGNRRGT